MNIGVIGAGTVSEIYLQNMIQVHTSLNVLGVADLNREATEMRAAQFEIKACTVEEMLADPEVEIVVNLPPRWCSLQCHPLRSGSGQACLHRKDHHRQL